MICQFIYFKQSGKFYTTHVGLIPETVFNPYPPDPVEIRSILCAFNLGCMPGLSTDGSDFDVVIVPQDGSAGYPLILKGRNHA